jgi:hypothetical protein
VRHGSGGDGLLVVWWLVVLFGVGEYGAVVVDVALS